MYDVDKKAMKQISLGLLINRIAMLVDDENLARIKPTLEELEQELCELFEQIKEVM